MSNEANVQRVLEYLRQHRDRYSLESLRQQLLAAGYSPLDVEAALARLDATSSGATTPAPSIAPDIPVSDQPPVSAAIPGDTPAGTTPPDQPAGQPLPAVGTLDETPSTPENTGQPEATPITDPVALASAEDERLVAQMVDYLQQYGEQYHVEALREQLLASGQRPALVEQALLQAKVSGPREPAAWPFGLLVMVLNLVVLSTLSGGLASFSGSGSDPFLVAAGIIPALMLIGELVAGLILLRGPRRRLGKIVLWGLLFTIVLPTIFVLLLVGICLVIIFGAGGFGF